MPHGSLSLPARLCLLAWDPAGTEATAAHLVRAGALAELVRRGLLTDRDGIATPLDLDTLTGDAVLDGLLELVRESLPHRWRTWTGLHARVTAEAVREQLTADGWLRARKKRMLGVFPSVEHVLERADAVDALRQEARDVWEARGVVREQEAAAVALAAAAGVRGVVPDGDDREQLKVRVEELVARSGVGGILAELCSALTPAL